MKKLEKRILLVESLGFAMLILLLWLDELLDIPHIIFGASETPLNWIESGVETVFVVILGIVVMLFSKRAMKRIRYLEGFLPVCAYCKKIRVGDQWIPIEKYISEHSEAVFSHGYCPECMIRFMGDD